MSVPVKRVVGVGAGGHARVMIEALRLIGGCELVGLLDSNPALAGTQPQGVPVLGDDSLLVSLYRDGVHHAFLGLGATRATHVRETLHARLVAMGFDVLSIVHPDAYVSASAHLGSGVTVMCRAVVQTGVHLDTNVIVNTGAIVEHDCRVGAHSHIASGATLAGGVRVGARSHIGAGAIVRESIAIGDDATVGAGAVVVAPVPAGAIVVGNPARVMRKAEHHG